MVMLEGQALAEEIRRRLVEVSDGRWEVLRITFSSFVAVGEKVVAVKMAEVGCLTVGKALVRIRRGEEAKGTFPNPLVRRHRVIFEGCRSFSAMMEGWHS